MYRSKLEKEFGGKYPRLKYEPFTVSYTQVKEYLPDFVNETKKIIFEVKGYFRMSSEAKKYIDVKRCNPDWEIIFVFSDPEKPLPWAKKRVGDGRRMTHKEWALKNGFKCCNIHTVKKEWL